MMEVSGRPHPLAAFLPGKNHNTHRTGGWVGPRAGIDGFGVQKNLLFLLRFGRPCIVV